MRVGAERRRDAAQDETVDHVAGGFAGGLARHAARTVTGGDRALAARLERAMGGDYRVLGELDGGGMSRLFLAERLSTHRLVAVKVLAGELDDEGAQLRSEAALTARLRHPHVLPVLAAGEGEGLAFLVTPWVSGGTLRDRLRAGAPLSPAGARRTLREIAAALAHVHAHGVVHGDLKPDNVLLEDGRVLLADFGVARRARPRPQPWASATGPTPVPAVGTPLYMSPEQAAGDPYLGPRSDVYSFGVLAFEILTGRPPFAGPTPRAVLLAHLGEPAPCVLQLRPDLPLDLVTVIARALAKDPSERYADGAALLAALDRGGRLPSFAGALPGARAPWPASAGAAPWTPWSSWRARAASMAGTLAATAGGLALSALGLAAAATLMLRTAPTVEHAPAPGEPTVAAHPAPPAFARPVFATPAFAIPEPVVASRCPEARKTRGGGKAA